MPGEPVLAGLAVVDGGVTSVGLSVATAAIVVEAVEVVEEGLILAAVVRRVVGVATEVDDVLLVVVGA